jgi:hypothetical protein
VGPSGLPESDIGIFDEEDLRSSKEAGVDFRSGELDDRGDPQPRDGAAQGQIGRDRIGGQGERGDCGNGPSDHEGPG